MNENLLIPLDNQMIMGWANATVKEGMVTHDCLSACSFQANLISSFRGKKKSRG
jgi:hypothetical protein